MPDALTYAGNRASLDGTDVELVVGGISAIPASSNPAPRARGGYDRPLRRGKPCRPLDLRPGRLHRYRCRRHPFDAQGHAPGVARPWHRATAPLPSRVDRRGLRFARPRGSHVRGDHALCADLALFGVHGPSDHFVRAYHHAYGPQTTSNCSNNYGPIISRKADPPVPSQRPSRPPLPIYDGMNVRDWLHVEDRCLGIERVPRGGSAKPTISVAAQSFPTSR